MRSPEVVFSCGGGEALGYGSETVFTSVIALHNTWTLRAGPKSGSWIPRWRLPLSAAILVASAALAVLLLLFRRERVVHPPDNIHP
jgi:hypothetical protein